MCAKQGAKNSAQGVVEERAALDDLAVPSEVLAVHEYRVL
jgi:hypothetical protein